MEIYKHIKTGEKYELLESKINGFVRLKSLKTGNIFNSISVRTFKTKYEKIESEIRKTLG